MEILNPRTNFLQPRKNRNITSKHRNKMFLALFQEEKVTKKISLLIVKKKTIPVGFNIPCAIPTLHDMPGTIYNIVIRVYMGILL